MNWREKMSRVLGLSLRDQTTPEIWLGDEEERKLNETVDRLRQVREELENVRRLRRQRDAESSGDH